MFKKIFDKFDKFVAVSLPVKNNFSSIYGQKDKIVVINNYVDDKKIINLAKEKKVKLSDCKLNLISVGRLHYDKGFHVLLKVLKRLDDDNLLDDVHFTLIGDGLEFDNLMKLKKEYKLDSKVSLLGSKSNPFIYLKNADLFILSSFHESFGNVIIESLVLHVPVLAVEVATIYEILDEKNGLIVKNNIDALYNGLKSLILNQDKIKEYKKNLNSYKYPNEEILNEIKKLLG